MDALEAILSRRSIRKYQDRPVPEEVVQQLLEAGMSAPTARNMKPWYFLVINERVILDAIVGFHPYAAMLREAPLAILVCGDREAEPMDGFLSQNCSAATENILLAAHALGLGAVWLGIYPRQERIEAIRQLIGLPELVLPVTLIAVGYPAEEKKTRNRYDRSKVRYNRW